MLFRHGTRQERDLPSRPVALRIGDPCDRLLAVSVQQQVQLLEAAER